MKKFEVTTKEYTKIIGADAMYSTDSGEVYFTKIPETPNRAEEKVAIVLLCPGMIIRKLPQ